jgi:hypothetical protein
MIIDPPPPSPDDSKTSEPLSASPATDSSKILIFHATTYPLPAAHIAQFRECINPAYTLSEKGLFDHLRIPDEDATEFLTPGRWIFACYVPTNTPKDSSEPLLPPVTDYLGITHELTGYSMAGTVSISMPPYPRTPYTPGFPIFPGTPEVDEFHLHLLVTSVNHKQIGVAARLLNAVQDFAASRIPKGKHGKIVGEVLEEVGNVPYYVRRGFTQEGEKWCCPSGTWGSIERFHLRRMVRRVEGCATGS